MNGLLRLVRRDDRPNTGAYTPTMVRLTIALLVLIILTAILILGLLLVRSRRRAKTNALLPLYAEHTSSKSSAARRLTVISTPHGSRTQSIHVYQEKMNLIENSYSPPASPDSIPEIRVTFPEEEDESGQRKSGRVVVVHVGDTGVGLESLPHDVLPPYQKSDADRFHSVDLERIGGLKDS
ncbi:MAG: hypothetical protein M1826_002955 [Phylliscum demangeonii]|nr:MAG: hypothetical protein M1826_002955 [Phylliscum demangeonii]